MWSPPPPQPERTRLPTTNAEATDQKFFISLLLGCFLDKSSRQLEPRFKTSRFACNNDGTLLCQRWQSANRQDSFETYSERAHAHPSVRCTAPWIWRMPPRPRWSAHPGASTAVGGPPL